MSKRVQLLRHDNTGANTFVGLEGETTVNTTNSSLHVHDNVTPGGKETAQRDLGTTQAATNSSAGKMTAAHVAQQETNTAAIAANLVTLNAKADKISAPVNNDVVLQDAAGNIKAAGYSFSALVGNVLATLAEINKLAGLIATQAELNYLSGATAGQVLTTGDNGTGGIIDADTVDGFHAAQLLARANHTGTQLLSTISDAGILAALNTVTQAEMSANSVGTPEIINLSVDGGKIKMTGVIDSTTGAIDSFTFPQGILLYAATNAGSGGVRGSKIQLHNGSTWVDVFNFADTRLGGYFDGAIPSSGSNLRILDDPAAGTHNYAYKIITN